MSGSPLAFNFDFTNLIISGKASGSFAAENDLYSDWKEQVIADATGLAASVPPAFLEANADNVRSGGSVGGNPIGNSQFIAPYFFINNIDGWRLRPAEEDGETTITGNLFPLDSDRPFIVPTVGAFTQLLRLIVSPQAIVDASGGALTAIQNALLLDVHGQVRRGCWINTERSPNGNGYQQTPYNNFTDAVDDAELNGLQTLYMEADAIVDRQLKNFEIFGIGGLPSLDLNGNIMDGSTLRNMSVTGTQGMNGGGVGQMICFECSLINVRNFDGAASLVGVIGTLEFQNGTSSLLNEVLPFVAGGVVTFDLQVAGSPSLPSVVGVQNASGEFRVTNMDDPGDIFNITMKHGTIEITASCTEGTVFIAGNANFTDNSGPNCTVIHAATLHPSDIVFIKGLVGGDAVVSLDDQTVTVYDNEVSPRQVLAVYSISADGRIRTRTS